MTTHTDTTTTINMTADLIKDEDRKEESSQQKAIGPLKRNLIFITVFFEVLLFGGIAGGWNVFVFVLKQDGIYSHVCEDNDVGNDNSSLYLGGSKALTSFLTSYGVSSSSNYPACEDAYTIHNNTQHPECEEQDAHFALAYTIATTLSGIMTLPAGLIFDRYGLRVSRLIGTSGLLVTVLSLLFASKELPWLMYLGASSMTVAGMPLMISAYHVTVLFGEKASTILTLFAGTSLTSGSVMVLVKMAADSGYGREYSLSVLLILAVLTLATTFFLIPRYNVTAPKTPLAVETQAIDDNCPVTEKELEALGEKPQIVEKPRIEDKEGVQSFKSCVCSPLWITHILWFAVGVLRLNYFVGTFNSWINSVLQEDKDQVSFYSDIYGFAIAASVFFAPAVGIIVDQMRMYVKDLGLTKQEKLIAALPPVILSISFMILLSVTCLIQSELGIILSIAVYVVNNSVFYSTSTSFIQIGFPSTHFGKLYGVAYFIGACFNLTQYGLFAWATALDDYYMPNIVSLALVMVTVVHALNILVHHLKTVRQRQKQQAIVVVPMPDIIPAVILPQDFSLEKETDCKFSYDNEVFTLHL